MAAKRYPPYGFDPETAEGHEQCSELGCPSRLGYPCQYVDRRGRACPTSWCTDHRSVAQYNVYCPRHVGLVNAFGTDPDSHRPDLDSRAASLVDWMARSLDADIQFLLANLPDLDAGERLIVEPMRLIFGMSTKERRWERGWKLLDHVAVTTRVALEVSEQADTDLTVRINGHGLLTVVPPWIEQRDKRDRLSPLEDRLERMQFEQFLIDAIRESVLASRRRESEFIHQVPSHTVP